MTQWITSLSFNLLRMDMIISEFGAGFIFEFRRGEGTNGLQIEQPSL